MIKNKDFIEATNCLIVLKNKILLETLFNKNKCFFAFFVSIFKIFLVLASAGVQTEK